MTFPLLCQFLSTSYKWVRLEKRESKKWSWILLLLQCWPQLRAVRIIHLDYNENDEKTERKGQELLREVTSTEPFLEAWPSIMIMTIIWVPVLVTEVTEKRSPNDNYSAVFEGFGGPSWFFTTFVISLFTGSLGITKFPQVGPFSVLSSEGAIGGILGWRFILAFQAVMWSMLSKGVIMAIFIATSNALFPGPHMGMLFGT